MKSEHGAALPTVPSSSAPSRPAASHHRPTSAASSSSSKANLARRTVVAPPPGFRTAEGRPQAEHTQPRPSTDLTLSDPPSRDEDDGDDDSSGYASSGVQEISRRDFGGPVSPVGLPEPTAASRGLARRTQGFHFSREEVDAILDVAQHVFRSLAHLESEERWKILLEDWCDVTGNEMDSFSLTLLRMKLNQLENQGDRRFIDLKANLARKARDAAKAPAPLPSAAAVAAVASSSAPAPPLRAAAHPPAPTRAASPVPAAVAETPAAVQTPIIAVGSLNAWTDDENDLFFNLLGSFQALGAGSKSGAMRHVFAVWQNRIDNVSIFNRTLNSFFSRFHMIRHSPTHPWHDTVVALDERLPRGQPGSGPAASPGGDRGVNPSARPDKRHSGDGTSRNVRAKPANGGELTQGPGPSRRPRMTNNSLASVGSDLESELRSVGEAQVEKLRRRLDQALGQIDRVARDVSSVNKRLDGIQKRQDEIRAEKNEQIASQSSSARTGAGSAETDSLARIIERLDVLETDQKALRIHSAEGWDGIMESRMQLEMQMDDVTEQTRAMQGRMTTTVSAMAGLSDRLQIVKDDFSKRLQWLEDVQRLMGPSESRPPSSPTLASAQRGGQPPQPYPSFHGGFHEISVRGFAGPSAMSVASSSPMASFAASAGPPSDTFQPVPPRAPVSESPRPAGPRPPSVGGSGVENVRARESSDLRRHTKEEDAVAETEEDAVAEQPHRDVLPQREEVSSTQPAKFGRPRPEDGAPVQTSAGHREAQKPVSGRDEQRPERGEQEMSASGELAPRERSEPLREISSNHPTQELGDPPARQREEPVIQEGSEAVLQEPSEIEERENSEPDPQHLRAREDSERSERQKPTQSAAAGLEQSITPNRSQQNKQHQKRAKGNGEPGKKGRQRPEDGKGKKKDGGAPKKKQDTGAHHHQQRQPGQRGQAQQPPPPPDRAETVSNQQPGAPSLEPRSQHAGERQETAPKANESPASGRPVPQKRRSPSTPPSRSQDRSVPPAPASQYSSGRRSPSPPPRKRRRDDDLRSRFDDDLRDRLGPEREHGDDRYGGYSRADRYDRYEGYGNRYDDSYGRNPSYDGYRGGPRRGGAPYEGRGRGRGSRAPQRVFAIRGRGSRGGGRGGYAEG